MDNIIEILKVGLPGLVFLLAAFSYRLLANEQEKENPSPRILKSIKHYAYVNVFLAILTVASPVIGDKFIKKNNPDIVPGKFDISDRNDIEVFVKTKEEDLGKINNVNLALACKKAEYINRYVLIEGKEKLAQVFVHQGINCTDEDIYKEQIFLTKDVAKIFDSSEQHPTKFGITVAPSGFMHTAVATQ